MAKQFSTLLTRDVGLLTVSAGTRHAISFIRLLLGAFVVAWVPLGLAHGL